MANKIKQGKRKPGGGRKPKAFTLLKRQLIKDGLEDAAYAYSLYVSVMRDDDANMDLRLDCAREVLDRVLGKAKQPISNDDSKELVFRLIYGTDDKASEGAPKAA